MFRNETNFAEQQYANDMNLSARINLHAKHSTNKRGFADWLWEHYDFTENCKILELGCGNGAQWADRIASLPTECEVVLSDFSEGMVNAAKERYTEHKAFSFQQIDIQNISFTDGTFDAIIANHMLYHVPDLPRGLTEVRRVLKSGGVFYASTLGNGGMQPYLHGVFKRFNPDTNAFATQFSFNLQNGAEILGEHFDNVKRVDYVDSLAVTETQDLIDWIKSSVAIENADEERRLFDHFEDIRKRDGAINIPKEAGLFISGDKRNAKR